MINNSMAIKYYLYDINGNKINVNSVVEDDLGFRYKFRWDAQNQEWVAVSLKESNKEYPMYQKRVNRNNLKIINEKEYTNV